MRFLIYIFDLDAIVMVTHVLSSIFGSGQVVGCKFEMTRVLGEVGEILLRIQRVHGALQVLIKYFIWQYFLRLYYRLKHEFKNLAASFV